MDAAGWNGHARENSPGLCPVYPIAEEPLSKSYRFFKRFIDMGGAVFGLIFFLPLMMVAAFLIRLTSKGPALYKQTRVGLKGRHFEIYKFRTMVVGAENIEKFLSADERAFYQKNRKLARDPRVTGIGAKLRASSIDELPQLLNVLKGDMSLVGPRPMLPEEVEPYGDEYFRYIQMRPGITGLWQIKSRHETQMSARATVDAEYYGKRCLKVDITLLFATAKAVLFRKGAY